MSSTGHHDSHTPEEIRNLWQTPRWFFQFWDNLYNFKADVAASEVNHLCREFINEEQDALTFDMSKYHSEYVFCNPPYRDIYPWVEMFDRNNRELDVGFVALLPADVSTKWFELISNTADEIIFITGGRLSFVRADTQESIGGNTKGSIVVIYNTSEMKYDSQKVSFLNRDSIKENIQGRV